MRRIGLALSLTGAVLLFGGSASAQFGQHFSKETCLPVWTWTINWGGTVVPIRMVFPNVVASPELPGLDGYYGVVSGNWCRWYFEGPIKKPISDLLICVTGKVFKEQFPQGEGYAAQAGRLPNGPIDLNDQPRISAWAAPADYKYAQPFGATPLPEIGSWNPYYLSVRILSGLLGMAPLGRSAPGIPGGAGVIPITLINGFQVCYAIKLPETGYATLADFDGDADNPLHSLVYNDTGNEAEVTLGSGDRIAVQIDIPPGHLHNIYLSTTDSAVVKYITPNP